MLLSSALAVGAAALPASATTWQDTGLSATAVSASTFGGGTLGAANGSNVISLSSGSGVTWSLHGTVPTGVTPVRDHDRLFGHDGQHDDYRRRCHRQRRERRGARDPGHAQRQLHPELRGGTAIKVSLSELADANSSGTVKFSATSSKGNTISFAESNLPAGLASGDPVLTYVGGNAAPGTYSGVKVTATDTDGAVLNGTFTLTVQANAVNGYGDEVNRFGNGFDSYQQHQYPGAIIAGWTATQNDPATHFILNTGTHQGAYQFEYAPKGTASGLCVSDPGGGWASDPLPDGLILANCNTGPWQQFVPQSNGTLKNVATGLYINPNGTGSQLRGGTSPTPWGGSSYSWTDNSSLPA